MNELDKLLAERSELDRRIKELKNAEWNGKGVRLEHKSYSTGRPDDWKLMIEVLSDYGTYGLKWRTISNRNDKASAVNDIDTIITNLKAFKEKIEAQV